MVKEGESSMNPADPEGGQGDGRTWVSGKMAILVGGNDKAKARAQDYITKDILSSRNRKLNTNWPTQ